MRIHWSRCSQTSPRVMCVVIDVFVATLLFSFAAGSLGQTIDDVDSIEGISGISTAEEHLANLWEPPLANLELFQSDTTSQSQFLAWIEVGSPPTKILALIDTAATSTFIVASPCPVVGTDSKQRPLANTHDIHKHKLKRNGAADDIREAIGQCQHTTFYDPAKSETAKPLTSLEGKIRKFGVKMGAKHHMAGSVYIDTIKIGGLSVQGVAIAASQRTHGSLFSTSRYGAILGLAPPSTFTLQYKAPSFLTALVDMHPHPPMSLIWMAMFYGGLPRGVAHPSWSPIVFRDVSSSGGGHNQQNGAGGALVIAASLHGYRGDSSISLESNVATRGLWEVGLLSISVGESVVWECPVPVNGGQVKCGVVFDSSSPYVAGPRSIMQRVAQTLEHHATAFKSAGGGGDGAGHKGNDNSKHPALTFRLAGGHALVIESEYYQPTQASHGRGGPIEDRGVTLARGIDGIDTHIGVLSDDYSVCRSRKPTLDIELAGSPTYQTVILGMPVLRKYTVEMCPQTGDIRVSLARQFHNAVFESEFPPGALIDAEDALGPRYDTGDDGGDAWGELAT